MYIRTKDWIYDTENLHYRWIENNKVYKVGWDVEKPTFEADIISQSENLEELCDEFVLHYGDTMQTSIPIPWATYERRDDNWQKHKEKLISELKKAERKATVYGAIWTERGLIYVAKIDNEGKLVLI